MTEPGQIPQFSTVYEEHFDLVWRWLRRLGVRECDAEDAAQEVFVVVHRRLPEFQGRSRLTTWLFEICYRVAQAQRRGDRGRSISGIEVIGATAEAPADSCSLLDQKEQWSALDALLDEIPLDQRAVFALYELEELTGEQIAQLLDVPVGTVWSRLRLARQAFRAAVQRHTARSQFELTAARGAS
jgi:RNA polymerase sigma-70 factor, ECF subfamily